MSWYSTGAEAADAVAASMVTKRKRNFFTKAGESAVIRFLAPATDSFNYKRSFVKWAKGEKMQTSYDSPECPLVQHPNTQLQAAFAWLVIDRRVLKFKDQQSGEEKEVGPRVLYFADGQRTRKQLISLEKQLLQDENEEREGEGKEALTLEEFNLTSYDLTVRKDPKAPWVITAKRPKKLTAADNDLVEKSGFNLMEELAPLPIAELKAMLGTAVEEPTEESKSTTYSYGNDDDDTVSFD